MANDLRQAVALIIGNHTRVAFAIVRLRLPLQWRASLVRCACQVHDDHASRHGVEACQIELAPFTSHTQRVWHGGGSCM